MAVTKQRKNDCLKKYELFYDKNDVILFNSRLLNKGNKDEVEREKGIMSNLYSGDFKIPYDGKEFHSSEQLLFYLNIIRWAKIVGYSDDEISKRIDYLMSCKNGFEVKNTPQSMYFYTRSLYNLVQFHYHKRLPMLVLILQSLHLLDRSH